MATTKKPATKKKPTKKVAPKKATAKKPKAAPKRKLRANENPHPRKLRGALLYELRSCALSVQLNKEKLENINSTLNVLSMDKKHAPVFAMLNKRDAVSAETKEATLAFAVAQKKVADKFKIPLERIHEYTFDTDTGAITPSKATT